jgi:hypothetical protein
MGQLQMSSVKPRKQSGDDDVEAYRGGIMRSYADGGITGGSNFLQAPLDIGEGNVNGYTPAGSGQTTGGFTGQNNNSGGGFGGTESDYALTGYDPQNEMGFATGGGISSLGGYATGGNPRLLKGPGDGMSDNIPATINGRQPARLADGEFVIPADVVSHLGNGSTEAGAKQLHAMMDKIRKARTGNPKQGKQINPRKYLPK